MKQESRHFSDERFNADYTKTLMQYSKIGRFNYTLDSLNSSYWRDRLSNTGLDRQQNNLSKDSFYLENIYEILNGK